MEELQVDTTLSDEEKYKLLLKQIDHLIEPEDLIISNLANFTAALKQSFDKISWVGFYFIINGKLQLGPFQGKLACTNLQPGKGVCWTSIAEKKSIVVEDVDKFPGHIACDSDSRSEIVVPLIVNSNVTGVLDIDSFSYSSFNETDKLYLEKIIDVLLKKINLESFILI